MTRPLSPEGARLAAALRELRERSGLTLAGLAAKTTYSKSSWERYLNGKTLPPRPAVEELCRLTGEPDGRCIALWEIAESEWGGRAREEHRQQPPPEELPPPPPAEPSPREEADPATTGHRRTALALAVLATLSAVVAGIVTVALVLLPRQGEERAPSASPTAIVPLCHGSACAGKDPMHLKCAVAPTTLAQYHTATGAWVEVRYSKACGTSWARMWGTRLGDRLEVTPGDGDAEVKNRADTDAYVYTMMAVTRPGAAVHACFVPSTPDARTECVNGRVR
ncbi:helix-turn-helix domain-containing protein [Streptomyces pseudovenezuelae]|uniref:Transcriptional regulator with XRE-family HTH domain n=1 Tax=Streptomyces pseudovenezuelae TaxID=67350 RepID=A0ABT6M271_9ACTN|nr:XRE family transcriptional regulator [Streptomyces pseudovenezuelae]MDH6222627.1 transcriptional regulator with XRE-family HTH domain [Streptomyces pseudovenezuelae]